MNPRDPADVLDLASRKLRVLSRRCSTCIFRPEDPLDLVPGRLDSIVADNLAAGALLTCHDTLPYGDFPDFGPAVCAGFWAQYGLQTTAGRIAHMFLGIVRIDPPGPDHADHRQLSEKPATTPVPPS